MGMTMDNAYVICKKTRQRFGLDKMENKIEPSVKNKSKGIFTKLKLLILNLPKKSINQN